MTKHSTSGRTHTSRIVIKAEPDFRERVTRAAEVRDGGNVSRLARRAINDLINRERLLDTEEEGDQAA